MYKFFMGFFSGVLFIAIFMVASNPKKEAKEETLPIKLEQPEFFLADKPTKELVKEACEYYNIQHSDIVVAQSILETGHYRSENCKVNNNLFGLFNSNKKEYFKFDHWTSSVKAYKDMIQYRLRENEDYYQFLTRISYALDSNYIKKVKEINSDLEAWKENNIQN